MYKSKIVPILLSSLLTTLLFIGCDSSSDSSADVASIEGQLVDNYVENVNYFCADGSTGITDIDGKFRCNSLPVTFQLGGLKLGEISTITSDKQIFPQDLLGVDRADVNDTDVMAMARFLQSCDSDANPDNGIHIAETIKTNLQDLNESFSAINMDSYIAMANIDLINEETTQEHLLQTTEFINAVNAATLVPQSVKDALLTSDSTLTQEIKNSFSFMGNEERLAYDVYNKLYESFPTVNQLTNIANNSEIAHIQAVQLLVKKYISNYTEFTNIDLEELGYKDAAVADMQAGTYDISELQNLYNVLIEIGEESEQKALEVGCLVEVTDIDDLDRDILLAESADATDVVVTFEFLRTASYAHYWAFDSGLRAMGITDGCCSLGIIDGVNYCHPEYPQNAQGSDFANQGEESGSGGGAGAGNGNQHGRN